MQMTKQQIKNEILRLFFKIKSKNDKALENLIAGTAQGLNENLRQCFQKLENGLESAQNEQKLQEIVDDLQAIEILMKIYQSNR